MNEKFRFNSELLEAWLLEEGRKKTALAKRLGIGRSTVGRMLGGKVPHWDTVEKLANLMGVEADTLLLPKADGTARKTA